MKKTVFYIGFNNEKGNFIISENKVKNYINQKFEEKNVFSSLDSSLSYFHPEEVEEMKKEISKKVNDKRIEKIEVFFNECGMPEKYIQNKIVVYETESECHEIKNFDSLYLHHLVNFDADGQLSEPVTGYEVSMVFDGFGDSEFFENEQEAREFFELAKKHYNELSKEETFLSSLRK